MTAYETDLTRNIGLKIGLGTVYIHTDRGLHRLEEFAAKHNWLDTIANAGIFTVFTTAILSVGMFFLTAIASIGTEPNPANNAKNAVLIPGVNDFIPLHATPDILLVVLITAAMHEAGHALLAFRANYPVEEWGIVLLFGVIPAGAYVKTPTEELKNGDTWDSLRVLAAGITANYILFGLTITAAILFNISLLDGYRYYFQIIPTITSPGTITLTESILFWMAFLNINLAIVNSLPIYGLDGGHMANIAFNTDKLSMVRTETLTYALTGITILLIGSLFIIPIIS